MNIQLVVSSYPMMFSPLLAELIGLNEAIVLQKLNELLSIEGIEHNGKLWVKKSIKDWKKEFPFWSESTIKRTFKNLEKEGLIVSQNFNESEFDKTKWYTINTEKLNQIQQRLNMKILSEISSAYLHTTQKQALTP